MPWSQIYLHFLHSSISQWNWGEQELETVPSSPARKLPNLPQSRAEPVLLVRPVINAHNGPMATATFPYKANNYLSVFGLFFAFQKEKYQYNFSMEIIIGKWLWFMCTFMRYTNHVIILCPKMSCKISPSQESTSRLCSLIIVQCI